MSTPVFEISRSFAAPRDLVWQAWTQRDALARWWGPKGFDLSVHRLEVEPGGMFLYRMKTDAQEMWGRFIYREISPPERLVFVVSFSDPDGNITRAPFFDGRWPLEVLNTVTFREQDGGTRVELRASPIEATPDEGASFESNRASMTGGFTGTFNQLEAYLQEQQNQGQKTKGGHDGT